MRYLIASKRMMEEVARRLVEISPMDGAPAGRYHDPTDASVWELVTIAGDLGPEALRCFARLPRLSLAQLAELAFGTEHLDEAYAAVQLIREDPEGGFALERAAARRATNTAPGGVWERIAIMLKWSDAATPWNLRMRVGQDVATSAAHFRAYEALAARVMALIAVAHQHVGTGRPRRRDVLA